MYNIKKILVIAIAVFTVHICHAQKILFEEDRTQSNDTLPAWGVNERHFLSGFTGLNFVAGTPANGTGILYGRSMGFNAGLRYKLKLTNVFALGAEAAYNYTAYALAQNKLNTFADSTFWNSEYLNGDVRHIREKFGFHTVDAGAFLRVNFNAKRGNYMGNFVDLGASADYILISEYVAVDKANNGMRKKTKLSNLPFIDRFQQCYFARIGFNWMAVTARYRPTNIFSKQNNYPELPRYLVGIELSLYSK